LDLKLFYWRDFVSFKHSSLEQLMRVNTVRAHQLFAIKAIADLSALFSLTNTAADLASIATSSNSEKTQQTVVEKTGGQIIEKISFRNANFGLTFGTSKYSLFLAD